MRRPKRRLAQSVEAQVRGIGARHHAAIRVCARLQHFAHEVEAAQHGRNCQWGCPDLIDLVEEVYQAEMLDLRLAQKVSDVEDAFGA
jgi:hypothetical protein